MLDNYSSLATTGLFFLLSAQRLSSATCKALSQALLGGGAGGDVKTGGGSDWGSVWDMGSLV